MARGPEVADDQGLSNYLRNGSFEAVAGSAFPYWTLAGAGASSAADASDYFVGAQAVRLTRAGADVTLAQDVIGETTRLDYVRGKTFTLSMRVKLRTAGAQPVIGLDDGRGQVWSGYATDMANYTLITVTKVVSLDATQLTAVCKVKGSPGSANFDACMLSEGNAIPPFVLHPHDTGDWALSSHNHVGAGVPVPEGGLSLSDVTTGNVSAVRHGFLPKLPNDPAKVFLGNGQWEDLPVSGESAGWVVTPGYAVMTEIDPETADTTTVARVLGSLIDLLKAGLRPGA